MSAHELSETNFLTDHNDEVSRLKVALDLAFGLNVRGNPNAPEDRVVFPLGVATRNLCDEEVIWFVHYGFGIAALRTARTLYECVVFSLYINKHPETWGPYLNTMHAQWAKVLRNVPRAEQVLPEIHKNLLNKVPNYGTGKYISLEWNDDRTVYDMALDVGISEGFHALAFNYASAFVHPSAVFFLRNLTQLSNGSLFAVGDSPQNEEAIMALKITHDMTINAIRLRVKYSDFSALRESLEVCEKDFFSIWGYYPESTTSAVIR